ncbi:imidazole glycerol phosphate synthase subunit HisH [Vibrio vulnificus]|uniref:imidazole glycerol phosphate synthase subunit HisH n=1 Tax=Vibrio vulnificus TaxID=672 RepID=UPI000CD21D03|nr:imidazole glycerol phosphate synthase subunit HisH [Vibrio vulnificus]EGQ7758588.1 imidazole glycerol phosphate synthase subunit HisH [Vibrio vulnificus]EGR7968849.1 imidazole glycerol phosphate synthase subunit HisH [Vibrio vulnificus]EJC6744744.1 imidazole glycerol phosphate synthase subunit HisH [Vibrio vulnificus]EJC6821083.1 imidazole glycerol phosphate synthase subunit HisH [Vibrio vulnificus]EJC6953728.1 imidazole glycerol phosphate synthase subunit HisH [Vibrio vulnificus]
MKIVIIDYDMGNVRSIENAINHIGDYTIVVSGEPDTIRSADCLILPGVGAFPDAMKKLEQQKLIDLLTEEVIVRKKPVLGICLGMQLLFESSEEIQLTKGLGWIPGKVEYMRPGNDLRVPHVGWNSLILKKENSLFDYLQDDKDFYFVHSLWVNCPEKYKLATFEYGIEMTASVQYKNIVGMQFHPEKSQRNGLEAIRSFLDWVKFQKLGVSHA